MHHHAHENPAQTEGRLIRWASSYDLLVNVLTFGQAKRLRTMTIDQSNLKPGDAVLDVGCGTGGVTIPAKQRVGENGRASGIDPAPEMITVAKQKAHQIGLDIDFRVGVIEGLPFPDNYFDAVTSSLMMHHLPEHLQVKGLIEIYRVLKPGGCLVIADMIRPKSSAGLGARVMVLVHHGWPFEGDDLVSLLKEAGFREITQPEERFSAVGFIRAIK